MTNQNAVAETGRLTEVERAFRLGWNFARRYWSPPPDKHSPMGDGPYLPGTSSDLDEFSEGELLIAQIRHDVDALADKEPQAGGQVKDAVKAAEAESADAGRKQKLHEAYRDLRVKLGGIDPHVGIALDLGRMLADMVLMPTSDDSSGLGARFGDAQLAYAFGLLDDLDTSFSDQAAHAVKGSLESWGAWIKENSAILADGNQAHRLQTLRDQGEIWRRILSGERRAEDLLTSDSYRKAALRLLSRLRGLALGYLRRWWITIVALLLVVATATWAIVAFSRGGATAVAGLIATGAGALGISWKAVSSTLGKVASIAEGPLWVTEVRQAIVIEATVTPEIARSRSSASAAGETKSVESAATGTTREGLTTAAEVITEPAASS